MPNTRAPRRGSMQFWPRKRAKNVLASRRSYPNVNDSKLLSFPGYKVSMFHGMVIDNSKTSRTKGEKIIMPTTLVECPPIKILSARFYKKNTDTGCLLVSNEVLLSNDKILSRKLKVPKKLKENLIDKVNLEDVVEIRVLCYTQPSLTSRGNKKPEIFESAIGGSVEQQLEFVKANSGKEIKVSDVFENGEMIDISAVTKGKGFQGTVKRFGVAIRQHKSEKTKRGIANLGAWTPTHVDFRVPQPGKMGYHTRTEYNKWLLNISNEDINPKGGFKSYGLVKNDYVMIKGSVAGSSKRVIRMTKAIRPIGPKVRPAPTFDKISLKIENKK
jgi:large subunit ribosomal protein L3